MVFTAIEKGVNHGHMGPHVRVSLDIVASIWVVYLVVPHSKQSEG